MYISIGKYSIFFPNVCWWACNGNGFRLFIYPFSTFWMLFLFRMLLIWYIVKNIRCSALNFIGFGWSSLICALSTFDSLSIWIIFTIFFPVSCMYWDYNAQHMANFHFVCAYFHVAKCEWTLERNIDTACKKVNVGQIDLPLQLKWAAAIDWMWKNRYIQINMHKTQPIFQILKSFLIGFCGYCIFKTNKMTLFCQCRAHCTVRTHTRG